MIPPETVASIHSAARVEDVVREYVTLKKRGSNLIGLCPFHNEKTPSFNVSTTKGIYKCFGCGKAGNSVNFVMEHEKLSYPEALRSLAKKYNIEIKEIENEEAREARHLLDSLYLVNQFGQEYYSTKIWEDPEGMSVGMSYFKERGFREETIKKFQLGYSLKKGDAFTNAALDKKYQKEYLLKLGLSKENERGIYDFFRSRVMFPIQNLSGKVIAFAGRTLSSDKKVPKYINSPESDIYNKSKVLYGIYQAKNQIRNLDNCFLVEGYTDVISMHQSGIENVVASSGTSLTKEQIQLVKRFTSNVTVLYDGDKAGINAALRGTDMILEADMNVRVVLLPEGEDPDSYVGKVGNQGFLDYVEKESSDFVLFKTNLLVEQTQDDPIKKSQLIHSIVDTLGKIPDPIKRTLYIQQVGQLMELREQVLVNEVNKIRHKQFNEFVKKDKIPGPRIPSAVALPEQYAEDKPPADFLTLEDTIELVEKELVSCLFHYGHLKMTEEEFVAVYVIEELNQSRIIFKNKMCQAVVEEFQNGFDEGVLRGNNFFKEHNQKGISDLYADLMTRRQELSPNWREKGVFITDQEDRRQEEIEDLVNRLKMKHVQLMIQENHDKMKKASDSEEQFQYLKIDARLKKMQTELAKLLRSHIVK